MKPMHVRIAPGVVRVFTNEEEYQAWAKAPHPKYLIHPALGIVLLVIALSAATTFYYLIQ